jgi:hypothetical protein
MNFSLAGLNGVRDQNTSAGIIPITAKIVEENPWMR